MNFLELAEQTIAKANQPLTANELWTKATEYGFDKLLKTNGKTPWATLTAQLYVDIRDNSATKFIIFGKRPTKFWLKRLGEAREVETVQPPTTTPNEVSSLVGFKRFAERELHPLLVKFVDSFHHFRGTKLKTILHENSAKSKKGYNKWLHPDLVGVYFSFNDKVRAYERVLIDFQNDFAINATRLFSFEMKIKVDMANLREYYFQAVSNSSWANEGYLVTLEIDEEVVEEVRRLANSFGIGLIRLDPENIEESVIVVPSAYRKELDLDTMDRLATENRDFSSFLQNIIDDNKIKKVNSKYDKVLTDDEYQKYIVDKGIIQQRIHK